jgi:hypothetical protein
MSEYLTKDGYYATQQGYSDDQNKSLLYYQGSGYGNINAFLRENIIRTVDEGEDSEITENDIGEKNIDSVSCLKHVNNIERAINMGDTYPNLILYRGLSATHVQNTSGEIVEKGFCSTTTDVEVAKRFTKNKCCLLTFTIPRDLRVYKFKYKRSLTYTLVEDEYLLQRNIVFSNIRKIGDKDGYELYSCIVKHYVLPSPKEERTQDVFDKLILENNASSGETLESLRAKQLEEDSKKTLDQLFSEIDD